jgi:hypothetical protein
MSTDSKDTAAVGAPPNSTRGTGATSISLGRLLWPLGLSLLVMAAIGYFTFEPEPFRRMVNKLNGWILLAAVGTVVLRVLFGGWRLHHVSEGKLGPMGGIRGQLAWDFFSNVTPSTIGGGPIAAAYLARDRGIPFGTATALILFSMLLDQFWFALSIPCILVAGFYFEVIPASLGATGAWTFTLYFLGLMGWVVIFSYATLFRPELLEKLTDRIFRLRFLRRFRKRVQREMRQLRHRARILRSQSLGFYLKGFALTLATWLNRYILVVFIIWSVYPDLDKVVTFLRSIALTLGSLILPTPGGSGGLEGLYALFMGPPLMPEALVAPTLLTWRVLGYYIFIALGAFLSTHQIRKSLRRFSENNRPPPPEPPSSENGQSVPAPALSESKPAE